jgi:hypothetical protein
LCDALQALSAALEAEKRRDAPLDQLKAAASHLRRAEKRLQAERSDYSRHNALKIGQAAALIEGLISQEVSQSAASQSHISDLLNYRAHREALLCVAWVMTKEALYLADNTSQIFAWDEAFNLIERNCAAGSVAQPEIEVNAAEAELEIEPMSLQDVFNKDIETVCVDNGVNPVGLWLSPVKLSLAKSSGTSQMLVEPNRYTVRVPAFEKIEIVEPQIAAGRRDETAKKAAQSTGIFSFEDGKDNLGFEKAGDHEGEALRNAGKDSIGNARNELEAWKEGITAILNSIVNAENAVKIIKALMTVVIVLLAIKVILYLI